MKILIKILLLLTTLWYYGHGQGKQSPLERAGYFLDLLRNNKTSEAYALFDSIIKSKITEDQLSQIWSGLEKQFGKLKSIVDTTKKSDSGLHIIELGCEFENGSLTMRVVINTENKISGFFFLPKASMTEYKIPEYVNIAKFKEVDIEFGDPEWIVHGTLSLPRRIEKPPAVILVHGSGPNDRDETIGPNKPFKDIAWGLASNGIVVLRYEKRTKAYIHKMRPEDINVKNEVIDDAIEAIKFLRARDDVDKNRIFLLGHSLGAMLAPTIAEQSKQLAGIIMLAAPARRLEDLVIEQIEYIYSLKTDLTDDERKFLTEIKLKVDSLKNKTLPPTSNLIGGPASYFYDLAKINQDETARNISIPMLFLQGGRDYQVTELHDFIVWEEQLENKSNVTFKLFPHLNHLFISGKDKSTPEEYNQSGSVDKEVLNYMVNWMKRN
ncbi:MAG: DUF3887 domain-containing protein [Bacteroidota bacterium]|nr:DUF3887 domain-containing protein [Bacteroidota bacterium]